MDRIWLESYPEGVSPDIDMSQHTSLRHVLLDSCAKYQEAPAYSNMGVALSFNDVDRLSRQFAAYLRQVAGLEKGDRVALMMPNILQYPIAIFGILRAGLVVVNCNPMYTPRELEHQLNDSGARAILVMENFAHTLAKVLSKTPVQTVLTTQLGDLFPGLKRPLINFVVKRVKKMVPPFDISEAVPFRRALSLGEQNRFEESELTHDDIAFLQYTGGTTGVAKGAILTHGNLVANMLQTGAWLGTASTEGQEVVIAALPLYHIYSLTSNALCYMRLGSENWLITNPRDTVGFVKELSKKRFTGFIGINTLFNALLNTPGFDQLNFSNLHVVFAGGMAVQRAVAERWKAVTGVPITEGYGLTETSPVVTINPVGRTEYSGSIGLPMPSTEVEIRNDDGEAVPLGELGELCVRGPQVMKGYWNRPEETSSVFFADGYLRTGDIARMDQQGFIYIEDRKKDMILVSGFNVYPNEVEEVAVSHPGVLEAAAIGVPDEKSGELVKLFVVKKDPALDAQTIIGHCRENLAAYKVPKQVEFRDELPKSNVGKILRRELRGKPPEAAL